MAMYGLGTTASRPIIIPPLYFENKLKSQEKGGILL